MPTPPAPNSFEMDGMVHYVGNEGEDCCEGFGKICPAPACGGYMHYQPVWGGYFYECERCHARAQ